jgi:hypothetical protein
MSPIVLHEVEGPTAGRTWESSTLLRIGRLGQLEVVLEDSSVSRYHAEVRMTDRGWRLRDLGSTNGTRLNGTRIGAGQWPMREGDLVQFGNGSFRVVEASGAAIEQDALEEPGAPEDFRSKLMAIPAERASPRKARLLACALGEYCGGDDVLDVAERHADGAASMEELHAARAIAQTGTFRWMRFMRVALNESRNPWVDLLGVLEVAFDYSAYTDPGQITILGITEFDNPRLYHSERHLVSLQMTLDLFGPMSGWAVPIPPPQPLVLAWQGGTVGSIAQSIYEERNHAHLPILADALEDAGCTDAALLAHCRQPGKHWRGCWAIDLLTGRE